ncbi:MAG: N-acetyl-gamma-glutamyl-phosphate reductase [Candidatus Omnitrophica bacterium]|nr:N-acetyl-gamma-glutamyl-phosphate reductase [Candidatus Omnitrophota bacterium]
MLKTAIVGATGYTGCELVKILSRHSQVELTSLTAVLEKPQRFNQLFPQYVHVDLICGNLNIEEVAQNCDLVFLALPHTVSLEIASQFLKLGKKVIDLSADYRLPAEIYEKWYKTKHSHPELLKKAVYGLPELYKEKIKEAELIANPGCYPTSVILALAPLFKQGMVKNNSLIIDSKTGVSGAGRKADINLHFSEVIANIKAYKVNSHQHIPEIEQELSKLADKRIDMIFTPHLIPVDRGILSTIYLSLNKEISQKEIFNLYKDFYSQSPFVKILKNFLPQTKDVIFSNYCQLGMKMVKEKIIVISAIDNLVKGAAGQAVQNMNIMCGFEETEGLM